VVTVGADFDDSDGSRVEGVRCCLRMYSVLCIDCIDYMCNDIYICIRICIYIYIIFFTYA
jgi:hypothetical protein